MTVAAPSISDLICNTRLHVENVRKRLVLLPASLSEDITRIRVALDTIDGDLDAIASTLQHARCDLQANIDRL